MKRRKRFRKRHRKTEGIKVQFQVSLSFQNFETVLVNYSGRDSERMSGFKHEWLPCLSSSAIHPIQIPSVIPNRKQENERETQAIGRLRYSSYANVVNLMFGSIRSSIFWPINTEPCFSGKL